LESHVAKWWWTTSGELWQMAYKNLHMVLSNLLGMLLLKAAATRFGSGLGLAM